MMVRLLFHREHVLGSQVDDMQVGCLWQGDFILSVSLSGHINYLDKANPSKPFRILKVLNFLWIIILNVFLKLSKFTRLSIPTTGKST